MGHMPQFLHIIGQILLGWQIEDGCQGSLARYHGRTPSLALESSQFELVVAPVPPPSPPPLPYFLQMGFVGRVSVH